jgi:hypothetical protein
MTCGGMMVLGHGFQEVLLEDKLEIMALKDYHQPPIFLGADKVLIIGSIMKETFGCLAEDITMGVNLNIHICMMICLF